MHGYEGRVRATVCLDAMLRVDTVKSERWNMRVSPEDDALVRAAAAESNESVSDFVLDAARAKAGQTLADRTVFYLDEERWGELMEMLESEPQDKPALRRLFETAREL